MRVDYGWFFKQFLFQFTEMAGKEFLGKNFALEMAPLTAFGQSIIAKISWSKSRVLGRTNFMEMGSPRRGESFSNLQGKGG